MMVTPGNLGPFLHDLSVSQFTHTEGNGIVSSIFEGDKGQYTLFLVNTSESLRHLTFKIDCALLNPTALYTKKNLVTGESRSGKGEELIADSVTLEPKQVVVFEIIPSP